MMWWKRNKHFLPSSLIPENIGGIKLSFCISHKNRFDFLRQTLERNLLDNQENQNEVEFVVVDFGSNDDVGSWIKSNFQSELDKDYLKFWQVEGMDEWHASKAKNTTHLLASGSVLVNLDCDNFTGRAGGKRIIDAFLHATNELIYWQYSGKKLDGSYGRIALTKPSFLNLGGYDESFLPMGFQDGDLIARAVKSGLQLVKDRSKAYNQAIRHEKFKPASISWKRMNEHNERLSAINIRNNEIVANQGKPKGLAERAVRLR